MDKKDLAPWNWFRRRYLPVSKEESNVWSGFDRDMERIFEDFTRDFSNFETFFPRLLRESANANLKVLPRVDISETDKEYIIEADLPGIKEEEVDISLSKDNILTIKGHRENKEEHKDRNYYRLERSYGSFERSLALPENTDVDKLSAVFNDGTLTLSIPKKEAAASETRKIQLNQPNP